MSDLAEEGASPLNNGELALAEGGGADSVSFGGGGAARRGKTNGFRSFFPSPALDTAAFNFPPNRLLGEMDSPTLPSPFIA